ncbi:hypothetical protein NP493_50g04065 [Ridgeia piscesae]|uniref:Uncharacterized protein n=1 Tax=Ridgeia piscesae TaxID=27915 RepID=A0AAD9PBC4_RIDPI|nr:hypothetical protein NP493_50g04065 [Ridgeia piscesae]
MSGLLGSLKKGLSDVGRNISKEADRASQSFQHAVDANRSSPILDLFRSGNVIQLISRSSGKCLEIVQAPDGKLIVDAHWTVLNEGNNIIRLYSGNNYLAIANGTTQIISVSSPALAGVETTFRLSQTDQFILLEARRENGLHVGILPTGELKSALATGRETHAHFGVRLIVSASGKHGIHPTPLERLPWGLSLLPWGFSL